MRYSISLLVQEEMEKEAREQEQSPKLTLEEEYFQ
jgi:hypothetical protein